LLENTSDQPVEITGLGVIPGTFALEHDELPLTIAAGERVRLELHFRSSKKAGADGKLQVQTPDGCTEIEVHAGATDASLFTQSDIAIDFGNVAPGASVDREFTVRYQGAAGADADLFALAADEAFSVVRSPARQISPAPCESFGYSVRLQAPLEPGPVRGSLTWSMKIRTETTSVDTSAAVPLFANVQ
jgi:hypothetical protein